MRRHSLRRSFAICVTTIVLLAQALSPLAAAAGAPRSAAPAPSAASTAADAWTRQPGETSEAFFARAAQRDPARFQNAALQALQTYLNQGVGPNAPQRSYEALLESYLSPGRAAAPAYVPPAASAAASAAAPAAPCPPAPQATIAAIAGPKGIAIDSAGSRAFVASYTANKLVVLDTAAAAVSRVVTGIPSPNQVAFDPALNQIYITNRDQNTLTVLDGATYAVLATIPMGVLPFGVAANPVTNRVYVANFESARVDVVDGASRTVIAQVPLANSKPTFIAVDAARNVAYVLTSLGEVYKIRADNTAERWLHLADSGLVGLAYNPALSRLYISSYANLVYVFDAANGSQVAQVSIPAEPHALAVNPNGNAVFVAVRGSQVHRIDGSDNSYSGAGATGSGEGDGLAVDAGSNRVFVSNYADNSVTVLADVCAPAPPATPTRTRTPTPFLTRTPTATPSPTPTTTLGLIVRGHVRQNGPSGPGVAGIEVQVFLAAYSTPARTAVTDANGYYDTGLIVIPGRESITVRPLRPGAVFDPPQYFWVHEASFETAVRDFVAYSSSGPTRTPTPTATATATMTPTGSPQPGDSSTCNALAITADEIAPLGGGRFRASGAIAIGAHFRVSGAGAYLDFDGRSPGATGGVLEGRGQVAITDGSGARELFSGAFSGNCDTGSIAPARSVEPLLQDIGGFSLSGAGVIENLNALSGAVLGVAPLDLANGAMSGAGDLQFGLQPGPDGLEAAGTLTFREDLKFGAGDKLRIRAVNAALADGCLSATGVLVTSEGEEERTTALTFTLCPGAGGFSAELGQLDLKVASATLRMKQIHADNQALTAASAEIRLPALMGDKVLQLESLRYDKNGLDLSSVALDNPIEQIKVGSKNGFTANVTSLALSRAGRAFKITFTGSIAVNVSGVNTTAAGSIWLDSTPKVGGSISSFNLTVAGLTIAAQNVTIDGDTLRAGSARLALPPALGGVSVAVQGVAVSPTKISIGGGEFTLPEISVGGFKLALHGSFKEEPKGTWIIEANGSFKLANLPAGPGCSGIAIKAKIRVTTSNMLVIDIAPADSAAQFARGSGGRTLVSHRVNPARAGDDGIVEPDGIEKVEIAGELTLFCTIPIPSTGFNLTSVTGSVTLWEGVTKVGIRVDLASQAVVGSKPVIKAVGGADLQIQPQFQLDLYAAISLFDRQVSQSTARITTRSSLFQLWVDFTVIRGQVVLNAWNNETGFHFTGQGSLTFVLPRGLFVNEWWLVFPPGDLELAKVDAAVGEFTNGAWGFRGKACAWKFCTGFYVDTQGRRTFGSVDAYQPLPPPRLAALRARWQQARLRGDPSPGFAEEGVIVNDDGSTIIIAHVAEPGDLMFILSKQQEHSPSLTLVSPPPDATVITPTVTLGGTVFYDLSDVGGEFPYQEIYTIAGAAAGDWQAVLDNLPADDSTYGVQIIGARPGPRLSGVTAANDGPTGATVGWRLAATAPITLSLFANPGPITTTVVLTDTVPPQIQELPDFTGYLLHTDAAPAVDGSPQTFAAGFGALPSGVYHIWAMADDGASPPVRVYAADPVTVAHPWPETWAADLAAIPGFRQLDVTWDAHPSPDVDLYRLNVSAPPYTATDIITVTGRLSAAVENLSPGETYRLWLDALDIGEAVTRTAHSQAITATTEIADFQILQDSPPPITVAGAVVTESLLLVAGAEPFPEAASLFAGAGLPDGFGLTFTPQVITPTLAGAAVSLVISTSTTLAPGSYTLPIAAAAGGVTRTLDLPALILAPDFSLAADPSPAALRRNGSARVTIRADGLRGMSNPILLSLEAAPPGLLHRFDPPSILPGATSTLVLTGTVLLAPGSYLVEVRGASLPGVRTTALPIDVISERQAYLPLVLLPQTSCADVIANGGFEANAGWTFQITGSTAGYTTADVHSGARAARFGLLPGASAASAGPPRVERNLLGETAPLGASYSSGYQTVAIPADAASATLRFWHKLGTYAPYGDFQRVLLLEPGTYKLIKELKRWLEGSQSWREAAFDLSAYRGRSIVVYFEVYNDSTGPQYRTWMFVDDVSVEACR